MELSAQKSLQFMHVFNRTASTARMAYYGIDVADGLYYTDDP